MQPQMHDLTKEWKPGPSLVRRITGNPANPLELVEMALENNALVVDVAIHTRESGLPDDGMWGRVVYGINAKDKKGNEKIVKYTQRAPLLENMNIASGWTSEVREAMLELAEPVLQYLNQKGLGYTIRYVEE